MPFIDSIVRYINESLKGSSLKDSRFQTGQYNGIASIVARQKGESIEQVPATVDAYGEYKPIVPDDLYSIVLYHKVLSNTYGTIKKSHGDDHYLTCNTEMSLVVWADGKKLQLNAEQLEPMIIYGLPQRLSAVLQQEVKMIKCLITPLASDMDRLSVFRKEYPQSDYFLKPYHHLFLLRYRVELTFDKACVDACLCGN